MFQLLTHTQLYDEEHASENKVKSTPYPKKPSKEKISEKERTSDLEKGDGTVVATTALPGGQLNMRSTTTNGDANSSAPLGEVGPAATMSTDATHVDNGASVHSEESEETPQMSLQSAIIFLIIVTVVSKLGISIFSASLINADRSLQSQPNSLSLLLMD